MRIEKPILLDLPMPIRTPRLVITPPKLEYAEQIMAAKEESMDVLVPWMTWAKDGPGTLDDNKEVMIKHYAQFILREDLMMLAFTHEGEFVVASGIHRIDWDEPMAEIGYWCKKSAHGKGYVTETANALIRYAFDVLKMRKMQIGMDSENTASENVARRLNMIKEFECVGGVKTLHPEGMRTRYSYCCFDTKSLPPLEVSW